MTEPKDEAREDIVRRIVTYDNFHGGDANKPYRKYEEELADQILNLSGDGWSMGIIATEEELPNFIPEARNWEAVKRIEKKLAGYKKVIWQGGQD